MSRPIRLLRARSIAGVVLALTLVAGCTSVDSDAGSATDDSTTTSPASTPPPDSSAIPGTASGSDSLDLWVPSSLGLANWFIDDIAPGLLVDHDIALAVHEPDLAYPEIEEAAAAGALDELHGMVLALPEVIGRRLVQAGVLLPSDMTLFSDPEHWHSCLGILLAVPASPGEVLARPDAVHATEAVLRSDWHGRDTAGTAPGDRLVPELVEELHEHSEEISQGQADVIENMMKDDIIETVAEAASTALKERGHTMLARTAARAVVVYAVYDFVKTMYEFEEATSGAIEASAGATMGAFETGYMALRLLQDLQAGLNRMRPVIAGGDICEDNALEIIDQILTRSITYQGTARDAAADVARNGRDPSWLEQLVDNAVSEINRLAAELRDMARGLDCGDPDPPKEDVALVSQKVLDGPWAAVAAVLLDEEAENPFDNTDGIHVATADGWTDIVFWGQARTDIPPTSLDVFESTFPCGIGPDGWHTVCDGNQPFPPGPTSIFIMGLDDAIPLDDPTHSMQFGWVFDDGNPANNYIPGPQFPMDTFQGTDLWFELTDQPAADPLLRVIGPDFTPRPTASRVTITPSGLWLFVPSEELGDSRAFRMTAFRHTGDWGMEGGPFNGDAVPPVFEPLIGYDPDWLSFKGAPVAETAALAGALGEALGAIASPLYDTWEGIPVLDQPVEPTEECWSVDGFEAGATPLGWGSSSWTGDGQTDTYTITVFDSAATARDAMAVYSGGDARRCMEHRSMLRLDGEGSVDVTPGGAPPDPGTDGSWSWSTTFTDTPPDWPPAGLIIEDLYLREGNVVIHGTFESETGAEYGPRSEAMRQAFDVADRIILP